MRRLKTVRRPPIYPQWSPAISPVAPSPTLPLSSRRPSVSFGGFGLIGLEGIAELHGIRETDDGLTLGAMATIAEIASHPVIRSKYTTLSEAAAGLATPQIRNLGTLGGNLTQRPRCWYFRNPQTVCLKKGGDRCYALPGKPHTSA